MRGGYPSAQDAGLSVPGRETIFARICEFGEGAIFTADDILQGEDELADDFAALRNHDYIHLSDGLLAGIVETEHLRRLPKLESLIDAYANKKGVQMLENGDWTAWKLGMKKWEPIRGHRYYTSGEADLLSYGKYMKIQVTPADPWMFDEGEIAETARAVFETFKDKEAASEIVAWIAPNSNAVDLLRGAADYLMQVTATIQAPTDDGDEPTKSDQELCAEFILNLLSRKEAK